MQAAIVAVNPRMPTYLARLATAARYAGCPPDQLRNFRAGDYVPQPKQLRFHAACRECDAPDGPTQVGFGGARGPGKSHALLAQMAIDDCQRYAGLKCLLLRKVGRAVREHLEDLRLRVLGATPHEYKRGDGVMIFPNGSRIILGHFNNESDVDAYLGLEYDVIGVEEATTLSLSKYRAIQSCNRTSKPGWRPRIYSTTNPGGVGHGWYKATFIAPYLSGRDGQGADTRFIPATVDDNVLVNQEYRQTLDSLTGWLKRAWRYGDWDIAAGQFFTTFRSDVHVVHTFSTLPLNWRVWLSMDYGFTHWNVIHLLAQDDDGTVYAVDELAERRWLVSRHAAAVRAMLARWGIAEARVWQFVTGADCFAARGTDQGSIADQWAAQNFELTPANNDRINGAAEVLKRLGDPDEGLAPTLFIASRCARLVECLPSLEHDPHRPEDVLKVDTDDDGNGGDDAYDALRYGVMAVARPERTLSVGENLLAGYRG